MTAIKHLLVIAVLMTASACECAAPDGIPAESPDTYANRTALPTQKCLQ